MADTSEQSVDHLGFSYDSKLSINSRLWGIELPPTLDDPEFIQAGTKLFGRSGGIELRSYCTKFRVVHPLQLLHPRNALCYRVTTLFLLLQTML
jgi:hypothetical protein